MKFSSNPEQRDHFVKNGFVAFEGLLSPDELSTLNLAAEKTLPVRGRDLSRSDAAAQKIIHSRKLALLAFDLVQKKPLRFAFDQVLYEKGPSLKKEEFPVPQEASFKDLSCIQPLEGLFLICIKADLSSKPEAVGPSAFALEPGCGIFVKPDVAFPFLSFSPSSTRRYLLIAYGNPRSLYLFEPKDPGCHFLKSLGYVFGDKLNEKFHPTLLR